MTDGSWKSSNDPGANWHNRDLDTSSWPNSQVLGEYGVAPWGKVSLATLTLPPPIYLRTEFELAKPIKIRTAFGNGAGHLRLAFEWPARERRLVRSRLDRLHQARLLPHLRRDRVGPPGEQCLGSRAGRRLVQRICRLRQDSQSLRQQAAFRRRVVCRVHRRHDANLSDRARLEGRDRADPGGRLSDGRNVRRTTGQNRLGPARSSTTKLGTRSTPAPS